MLYYTICYRVYYIRPSRFRTPRWVRAESPPASEPAPQRASAAGPTIYLYMCVCACVYIHLSLSLSLYVYTHISMYIHLSLSLV